MPPDLAGVKGLSISPEGNAATSSRAAVAAGIDPGSESPSRMAESGVVGDYSSAGCIPFFKCQVTQVAKPPAHKPLSLSEGFVCRYCRGIPLMVKGGSIPLKP